MIEGIDYYPKKSKTKRWLKIFVVGLIIVLISLLIYIQFDFDEVEKPAENRLILIEKPAPKPLKIIDDITLKADKNPTPKLGNQTTKDAVLDEPIQTFEQQ
jgi:hypothetical protein